MQERERPRGPSAEGSPESVPAIGNGVETKPSGLKAVLRERLGLEPFALHREFLAARGKPRSPSAVGEPKQAKAWLERLSGLQ